MRAVLVVLFAFVAGCEGFTTPPPHLLRGYIGGSEPVRGATIDIRAVDADTGEYLAEHGVIATVVSDDDGLFEVEIEARYRFVALHARDGYTAEYWWDEPIHLGYLFGHLTSVVRVDTGTEWDENNSRPVTMTPWTALTHTVALARYRLGLDERFQDSLAIAHSSVRDHVLGPNTYPERVCSADLTCLRPSAPGSMTMDAPGIYTLSLMGLAAVANEVAYRDEYAGSWMNSFLVTKKLLQEDAGDGDFDGVPEYALTANSLRADLGNAVVVYFLATPDNTTDLDVLDVRGRLAEMARNVDQILFGSTPLATFEF